MFEVYIWALWFMDAELYPAIELTDEARAYGPAVWKYLKTYPLPPASFDYPSVGVPAAM